MTNIQIKALVQKVVDGLRSAKLLDCEQVILSMTPAEAWAIGTALNGYTVPKPVTAKDFIEAQKRSDYITVPSELPHI